MVGPSKEEEEVKSFGLSSNMPLSLSWGRRARDLPAQFGRQYTPFAHGSGKNWSAGFTNSATMIDDIVSASGCDYSKLANLSHLISQLEESRIGLIELGSLSGFPFRIAPNVARRLGAGDQTHKG